MKKRTIFLLILAVFVVFVTYYVSDETRVRRLFVPDVQRVTDLKVRLSDDTAFTRLRLVLQNKGLFNMNIDSVYYHIRFDTVSVLNSFQHTGIELRTGQSDTIDVPLAIPYVRLIEEIRHRQMDDSVHIHTEARFVYGTVFGRRSLPHEGTDVIAMPRPPAFQVTGMVFAGFNKGKVLMDVTVRMINPGNLELAVSNLELDLHATEAFEARGNYPETIQVQPQSELTRTFRVELSVTRPLRAALAVLDGKQKTGYWATVTGDVTHKGLGKDPVRVTIEKSGEF